MRINMKIFYIRDNDLYFKEEDGKILVLKKNKKEIVELNEVGSLIWKALKTKKSIDALVKKINSAFEGADSQEVKKDVEEFILKCLKDSIIEKIN